MAQEIEIQAVDTEHVEKDESFPQAYAFYILLTAIPGPIWKEYFISNYERGFYNLKREVTLIGDRVRIVTAPDEEASHVRFIRELVRETNRSVEERDKILTDEEAREGGRKALEDAEAEQIRQRLKNISVR